MSVFENWSMALEDCDADAQIDYLLEDFEFVRHQSGTSLNKFEMANMMRSMLSNEAVVSSANRCLYENNEGVCDALNSRFSRLHSGGSPVLFSKGRRGHQP